jgi:hypothetical protein
VLENVNSEEKEVLFANLLTMELQDRKEKLGSYSKLARFSEDHVGHHIVMSVPLLSLGTDKERDTEDYTIMPTDHLAAVLNFSYYTLKNKKYIQDTIDYLFAKGVNIAKFINYYDTEEFFTRNHIIDYTTGFSII